jgi:hypothetical protein
VPRFLVKAPAWISSSSRRHLQLFIIISIRISKSRSRFVGFCSYNFFFSTVSDDEHYIWRFWNPSDAVPVALDPAAIIRLALASLWIISPMPPSEILSHIMSLRAARVKLGSRLWIQKKFYFCMYMIYRNNMLVYIQSSSLYCVMKVIIRMNRTGNFFHVQKKQLKIVTFDGCARWDVPGRRSLLIVMNRRVPRVTFKTRLLANANLCNHLLTRDSWLPLIRPSVDSLKPPYHSVLSHEPSTYPFQSIPSEVIAVFFLFLFIRLFLYHIKGYIHELFCYILIDVPAVAKLTPFSILRSHPSPHQSNKS